MDSKSPKPVFRDLAQLMIELRHEAKEKGIDKMTMREINSAVIAARRDQKKTIKRPAR